MDVPVAPVDDLRRALDAAGEVIAAIGAQQWTDPTPCTDWDVRALVEHLVAGNRFFAGLLSGAEPSGPEVPARAPDAADESLAYQESADLLCRAFAAPGALERPVTLPIGRVPGIAALQLRLTETLVHGWDLARATGARYDVPDGLAEQALAFTEARLGDVPADRSPFGPPQPAPADAPAIDRLAAALGRPPATGGTATERG